MIAACLALMGAAYVLLAAVDAVWQFLLVYGVLGGIGFAGSGSLAVTVLVSRWYAQRRTAVFRWVFLGINAGQLTLAPLGGLLIEQAGYRAACVVLGLLVLVLVVPFVALLTIDSPERAGQFPDGADRPAARSDADHDRPAAVRSRAFWLSRWRSASTAGPSTSRCCTCRGWRATSGPERPPAAALLALAAAASAAAIVAHHAARRAVRQAPRRRSGCSACGPPCSLGAAALVTPAASNSRSSRCCSASRRSRSSRW